MGRLSTRSNPTGLREIEKRRVDIQVSMIEGRRYFNLFKLDLSALKVDLDDRVICVARAGKTSQRFDIGTVAAWKRESLPLDDLDQSELLRFRILVHPHGNPKISASAENLRPLDESQSESLLPMEPAELGQLLWRLEINEDGPVLKFNSSVFPSASGVENYLPFAALVLPEAVRNVIDKIADEPAILDDDAEVLSAWGPWIDSLGLDRPSSDTDKDEKQEWCARVVEAFCNRYSFAARLGHELAGGGTDHD
jgi:hypothetical protein